MSCSKLVLPLAKAMNVALQFLGGRSANPVVLDIDEVVVGVVADAEASAANIAMNSVAGIFEREARLQPGRHLVVDAVGESVEEVFVCTATQGDRSSRCSGS